MCGLIAKQLRIEQNIENAEIIMWREEGSFRYFRKLFVTVEISVYMCVCVLLHHPRNPSKCVVITYLSLLLFFTLVVV